MSDKQDIPEVSLRDIQRKMEDHRRIVKIIRITIAGRLYVQRPNEQPEQFNLKSDIEIPAESDEQVWNRDCKLTTEWEPIDCGWLDHPSKIVLFNTTGTNRQVLPSRDELEQDKRHIIHVTFDGGDPAHTLRIRPREHLVIDTEYPEHLLIRSEMSGTKLKVIAIPG